MSAAHIAIVVIRCVGVVLVCFYTGVLYERRNSVKRKKPGRRRRTV